MRYSVMRTVLSP